VIEGNRICQREGCGKPLPPGSRSDRKWCSSACQSWWDRRNRGLVQVARRRCSSCLQILVGYRNDARVCRARKCRAWAARNPGEPHPSTHARFCAWCKASIDHLNGKAKYCCKEHSDAAWNANNREVATTRQRDWSATDRGQAYQRQYRQANLEKRRQWNREGRQHFPDRYRGYWRKWADANPEVSKLLQHLRRSRLLNNPGSVGISPRDWQKLVYRYQGRCAYCDGIADPVHMDHVLPLAKGGRHAIGNVLPVCGRCNQTKHAMLLSVWRYRRAGMTRTGTK
jgi:hypothetical protein